MNEAPGTDSAPGVAFVDLDDTLFSSLRRQPAEECLVPAARLADGSIACRANPAQRGLHTLLAAVAVVIPVTARNVAAFRRVMLPFSGPAICSHGATILDADGRVDENWCSAVAPRLAVSRAALESFTDMVRGHPCNAGQAWRTWLVDDGSGPAYAVVKHPVHDEDAVRSLASGIVSDWLRDHPRFSLHVNGNNLAVIPPGIGKAAAVAHLIARLRAEGPVGLVVGAGDSTTDLGFMDLCDVMLLPTGSQLAGVLRRAVGHGRHDR